MQPQYGVPQFNSTPMPRAPAQTTYGVQMPNTAPAPQGTAQANPYGGRAPQNPKPYTPPMYGVPAMQPPPQFAPPSRLSVGGPVDNNVYGGPGQNITLGRRPIKPMMPKTPMMPTNPNVQAKLLQARNRSAGQQSLNTTQYGDMQEAYSPFNNPMLDARRMASQQAGMLRAWNQPQFQQPQLQDDYGYQGN